VAERGRLRGVTIFSVWSPDLRKSFEWYRDKLGLQVHDDTEVQPGEPWVTLNVPDHPELVIAFKQGAARPGETLFGLETDDVHALYATLKAKGVVFRLPPTEFPYGTEADLEDLDGQVIAITQPASGM